MVLISNACSILLEPVSTSGSGVSHMFMGEHCREAKTNLMHTFSLPPSHLPGTCIPSSHQCSKQTMLAELFYP